MGENGAKAQSTTEASTLLIFKWRESNNFRKKGADNRKRPQNKSLSVGDQGLGVRVDVGSRVGGCLGIEGGSDSDSREEDRKGATLERRILFGDKLIC